MKVCVLQPDYSGSGMDYGNYDPRRNLSALLPGDRVDHIFLKKLTVFSQINATRPENYDIYVNLCEGYYEWTIPSFEVIWCLDYFKLPYTGPTLEIYHPSKSLMKYVAFSQGVHFPDFIEVGADFDARKAELPAFPLFVKPSLAGDSLGIDENSLVRDRNALGNKIRSLAGEFDRIIIEEFIPGREFTVLVAGAEDGVRSFTPLEFLFDDPTGFKTYALKITEHHPERNKAVTDKELAARLRLAAEAMFTGFSGCGYARLDFRMDSAGNIRFLDINFACSIFYPPGYEGSADYILALDEITPAGFLQLIIREGIKRHRERRKLYERRSSRVSGFGIFAVREIAPGEIIFPGEEMPHRLVSEKHVSDTWSPALQKVFAEYAWQISPEYSIIWDRLPDNWAPQNHSCDPNTELEGLNLLASRQIREGEELTIHYGTFCHVSMPDFRCNCGAGNCEGVISLKNRKF